MHLAGNSLSDPDFVVPYFSQELIHFSGVAVVLKTGEFSRIISNFGPFRFMVIPVFRLLVAAFLLCLLAAVGCAHRPSRDVLTEDQMVELLKDFYLQEARYKEARLTEDSAVLVFTRLRGGYASGHGYSDSIIDRSMIYYLDHPDVLNSLYDRVIDSLVLQEQRLKAKPQRHAR